MIAIDNIIDYYSDYEIARKSNELIFILYIKDHFSK